MRPKRSLDEIIKGIGTVEVRCGLCCHEKEPCDKCKEETRLANWHTDAGVGEDYVKRCL
jgi:hypothetical protein